MRNENMWIEHEDQWYNLSHFSNVWIEQTKSRKFVMVGQMQLGKFVLSKTYGAKEDLIKAFRRLIVIFEM